jgi:hypothetical protein
MAAARGTAASRHGHGLTVHPLLPQPFHQTPGLGLLQVPRQDARLGQQLAHRFQWKLERSR